MSDMTLQGGASASHAASDHHDTYDYVGSKMGIWLFLFTEVLLFGGLFLLLAVYWFKYPEQFAYGSAQLKHSWGAVNTFVLLISSITIGLSLTSFKRGKLSAAQRYLVLTILLSVLFMVIKFVEWIPKFQDGIYPGSSELVEKYGAVHDESGALLQRDQGVIMFYGLYFIMTGLHGVHVIVGAILMGWMIYQIRTQMVTPARFVRLENVGLYWDLVHLVWVFLFPFFYFMFVLAPPDAGFSLPAIGGHH